jgi:hypothetical protein
MSADVKAKAGLEDIVATSSRISLLAAARRLPEAVCDRRCRWSSPETRVW